MKYKALLLALLAAQFKTADLSKITEQLDKKEEELDDKEVLSLILEQDKARVKEIGGKNKTAVEDAKKAAVAEFEAQLREQFKLGADVELNGLELVNHIVEANKATTPKELDETAVKRHKAYIQLQDSLKSQLEAKDKDWKAKLDETVKGHTKEQTFKNASTKALEILDSLKPILSTDPAKAAKQKAILVNELKGYEFEEQDGKLVVLKDGKVVEDGHGYRRSFEDIVKDHAGEYFDFQVSKVDRNAPNAGDQDKDKTPPVSKYAGIMPKNEDEYVAAISNDATPLAERIALKDAWAAQQSAQ